MHCHRNSVFLVFTNVGKLLFDPDLRWHRSYLSSMLYEHLWIDAWSVIDKILWRSKNRNLYNILYILILLFNPVALYPGPLSNALIADILLFNRFFVELIGMHSERVSTSLRVNASVMCGNSTVTVRVAAWQVLYGSAFKVYPTPVSNCLNASYGYSSIWDHLKIVLVMPLGSCGATVVVFKICLLIKRKIN